MVPSLVMPYIVLYGCSLWLEACADVALFAAAHPAAITATAVSAMTARMQDNARLKTFPLTVNPVDFLSNKAPIWRPQGKAYHHRTPPGGPKMVRGPAR